MLHRRLWNGHMGAIERGLTLNDTSTARSLFWLLLGPRPDIADLHPRSGLALQHRPIVLLGELTGKGMSFQSTCRHHPRTS